VRLYLMDVHLPPGTKFWSYGTEGTAVPFTADTGCFWFFDPANVEGVTKVLNGCGVDAHYRVFGSGLTNTATGARKSYSNAVGAAFEPVHDTSAFATCP
jgi:hypothetical protein